jgi:hypothetical protein
MKIRKVLLICCLAGSALDAFGSDAAERPAHYGIVATIPGNGAEGIWDYATIDADAQRLYLAQDGVTLLDMRTGSVTPHYMPPSHGVVPIHCVLPVGHGDVAMTDASTNSVAFFHADTGKIFKRVKVGPIPTGQEWHNPDQIVIEPTSGLMVAVSGDSGSLSLIDLQSYSVVGTIAIGGKLEFSAADGSGLLYVNEETNSKVAFVDVARREVIKEVTLKDCDSPTGLALDIADRLVITVCLNGLLKFISTNDGKEMASIKVGRGGDGVLFDKKRRIAFSPSGSEGTMTIVRVGSPKDIRVIQTVMTQKGSRLGALDEENGKVYLPAAKFGPPAAPLRLPGLDDMPGMNAGTFGFLVLGPQPNT